MTWTNWSEMMMNEAKIRQDANRIMMNRILVIKEGKRCTCMAKETLTTGDVKRKNDEEMLTDKNELMLDGNENMMYEEATITGGSLSTKGKKMTMDSGRM